MLKRLTLMLAAVAMTSSLAVAHDDHAHDGKPHEHAAGDGHDHDHAAKHGGIVVHSGHHHLELVLEDGALRLHVTNEDGKPENVDGAKATATVLSGGKTETVTLAPAGETLEGSGSFTAEKGATVIVNLTLPDHETEQARFRFD